MSGAAYPKTYKGREITPAEGTSLLTVLESRPWERRGALFWEHEGNRAVREGPWKLVSRHPDEWELYKLDDDRTEMHNLAEADPQRVRRLGRAYAGWARRCGVIPWAKLQSGG
jgi:arylsulfatase